MNPQKADSSKELKVQLLSQPLLPKNKSKLRTVIFAIIICSFFQSLTGNGLSSSLNLFLTRELNESKATASANTSLFVGSRYFLTLLGAMIADKWLGRYKTIIISILVYLIAMIGVNFIAILLTIDYNNNNVSFIHQTLFWISLYIIAFGGSGMGTNIATLGAEQFSLYKTDDIKRKKESFFQWRYFAVNIGSLIAFTVVAYLCQNINFGVGYSVPTISILFCFICFIIPSKYYLHTKPIAKSKSGSGQPKTNYCCIFFMLLCCKHKLKQYPLNDVNDMMLILKVIPVVGCYIIYWSVWSQFITLIYAQGCQMNYIVYNWEFPIASLNIFRIIVVLILIPVFDRCIFPLLRKRCALRITTMQKMGFGFGFAILSMIFAGLLEIRRKNASLTSLQSVCDDDDIIYVSNISIFWQIPTFILQGISEVLTSTTGYEFFFNEAPKSMKSTMTSLFTISVGLGSWLNSLYVILVNNINPDNKWITNDLNNGHLDWYFFMVAGLTFIAFIIFIIIAINYKYQDEELNVNDEIADNNERLQSELSSMSKRRAH